MKSLELISFTIISKVGMAKSNYIEAMKYANLCQFDLATQKIQEGDEEFNEGHLAHGELIQQEASGDNVSPTILLMHAEDQLMAAETIKIMALEIITMAKKIEALEKGN